MGTGQEEARATLSIILYEHSHEQSHAARREADRVYGEEIPAAVYEAVYFVGECDLPGYLVRTIRGPRSDEDREVILNGLRATRILDNPDVANWFAKEGERCTAISAYMITLDCMRLKAIEILVALNR